MALPSPSSVCAVTAMVGLPRESSTSSAVRPVSRGTPEVYLVRDGGPGTEGAGRMHAEPVVEQRRRVLRRMERRVHHDRDEVAPSPLGLTKWLAASPMLFAFWFI